MAEAFTMFEKFGDACQCLSRQDGDMLLAAICRYGMFGEEPDLPPHLAAVFAMARDDVDNSKGARKRGSKGGRPKPEVSESTEPEVSEDAKPEVTENEKPVVSETSKPEVTENLKPNTNQANTSQTSTRQGGKRFAPPAQQEVDAYAADYAKQKGLDPGGFDAERFCDYYSSNGWKVGRNPMRDWRATVRDWVRRDCKERGPRNEYSDL